MKRSSRPVALAALALLLAGVSGCSLTNEQTTQRQYTPGDGTQARLGQVDVLSVLVLASAADAPGTLIARVVNGGSEDASVTLSGSGDAAFTVTVDAPAGGTVDIGPKGDEVVAITPAGAGPGLSVPVTVTTDAGGTAQLTVPVLDGTLQEYADLVPKAG